MKNFKSKVLKSVALFLLVASFFGASSMVGGVAFAQEDGWNYRADGWERQPKGTWFRHLDTDDGKDYLAEAVIDNPRVGSLSHAVMCWLISREGYEWLDTASGQKWLGGKTGQGWLEKRRGGQQWLATSSGTCWLATIDGKAWLKAAPDGQPRKIGVSSGCCTVM